MIITEIGEVGIECRGKRFLLRPSLYAMTQIGEPEEIVRVYASVMTDVQHIDKIPDALVAIQACCEEDISDVFGTHAPAESNVEFSPGSHARAISFTPAVAAPGEIVFLAQHLLRHGVIGALAPLSESSQKKGEYTASFDAREHASIAVAHLGVSTRDAWQMTMTELSGALRAKYPPEKPTGADAPSKSELDEALDWHDRVLAARNKT